MDPAEGVEGIPPEAPPSRPPDEAEAIIKQGSPRRLAAKIAAALLCIGGALAIAHALRLWRQRALARSAPMVSIPAGVIRAGPRGAAVSVAPFQIDATEVTVAAYALCVRERSCVAPWRSQGCNDGASDRDDHPINCVDWFQAKAFCAWLGKRLPTEEEWEVAARGPEGRDLPWGSAAPAATRLNACDSECRRLAVNADGEGAPVMFAESDGFATTAPVGSFPAGDSPFGVKDMAGNVAEWTASAYCPYGAQGSPACASEVRKVVRGGSFRSASRADVESATRAPNPSPAWSDAIGIRCAR